MNRNLVNVLLLFAVVCFKIQSQELVHEKSGLPLVLTVKEFLDKSRVEQIGHTVSVTGYLFFKENDQVAYLFRDISSLVAFNINDALIVEIDEQMLEPFLEASLCHVVIKAVIGRNGLSKTNALLNKPSYLSISEVFSFGLSKADKESYECFLKTLQSG